MSSIADVEKPLSYARAHALLHVTVFLWGFTAILGKLIQLNAVSLVWYRQVIAALVLLVIVSGRGRGRRLPWATLRMIWGVGLFVALHWVTFYACIKMSGIGVAVICLSTISFFVSLFEPFIFRRSFRPIEAFIGVAVVGGVLLLTRGAGSGVGVGVAVGIFSAMCSALFSSLNGKLIEQATSFDIAFHEMLAATVWVSLVFVVMPGEFVVPSSIGWFDWGWLTILAVACTVFPWLWSLRVLRTVGPFAVALAVNLEPVYSLLLAYVLFPDTERLSLGFYLGAGLLLMLVAVHSLWKSKSLAQPIPVASTATSTQDDPRMR